MDKAKLIDEVQSEICDHFCKWPTAPAPVEVPEEMRDGWLYDWPDSPCNHCPLEKLEELKND